MAPVAVEITGPPRTEASGEIEFVPDVDALLSSPQIAPGCGNDNPYQQ
jgi:hypothetical protein